MKRLLVLLAFLMVVSCAHIPRSYDINLSTLQGESYLLQVERTPSFSIKEKTLVSSLISSANEVAFDKYTSGQSDVSNSYKSPVPEGYLDNIYSALEKEYKSKLGFTEAKGGSYNYILKISIDDIGLSDNSIISTKSKMFFGTRFWLTNLENNKYDSLGGCRIWSEKKYSIEEIAEKDMQLFKDFLNANLDKCIEKSIKGLDYSIERSKRKNWD